MASNKQAAGFDKRGRSRRKPSAIGQLRATYSEQLAALHQVVRDRERVDRLFGRDGSTATDRLLDGARRFGLPEGSLNVDWRALAFGGYDRPLAEVWNTEGIAARYRESSDPEMYCGWCKELGRDERFRSKDQAAAFAWWNAHAHECCPECVDDAIWLAA